MGKKILIIIGNGFSIDFISKRGLQNEIDLINLFNNGDLVPWLADSQPGFLSYRRTPNLWNLGARPSNLTNEAAYDLIETIITCANMYAYASNLSKPIDDGNIYIKAYKELALYLKYLFIYYNSKVDSINSKGFFDKWGWSRLFKVINQSEEIDKITIISYNYDIWLERVLNELDINFYVDGIEEVNGKFNIIKPHGSISFQTKTLLENSLFGINYSSGLLDGELSSFKVEYNDLNVNSLINPMIPPAGDSNRYKSSWSTKLHELAIEASQNMLESDEVLLSGISYWHVDRLEIDRLILELNKKVNLKMINPKVPPSLDAVLSTTFENYTLYSNSNVLGGLYEK